MTPLRTALTTAAAALALLVLGAAPASAAQPCWKRVVNDWYRHGDVRGTYPVHCYTEALRNLPEDSKIYSSAPDDIRRAMLLAIRSERGGGPGGPSPGVAPSSSGGGTATGGPGFLGSVFDTFAPKNADGVPVPLIVLGVVALLLLAAGGASVAARRVQSRRIAIAPHEPPSEPSA